MVSTIKTVPWALTVYAVQSSAPASTLLVFRTASQLRSSDCDPEKPAEHGNNHIAQMNAKGRAVLRHHPRWKLMDVEKLTLHSHCSEHLRDSTHLNEHFTWTVLNLYVNMLKGFTASKPHMPSPDHVNRRRLNKPAHLLQLH